jgi:hypothetical protein
MGGGGGSTELMKMHAAPAAVGTGGRRRPASRVYYLGVDWTTRDRASGS